MTTDSGNRPIVVGITGASGSALAQATVELLLATDVPVILIASSAARMVWAEESEESFGEAIERWTAIGDFTYHSIGDLRAPIASGTFPTKGMVVVPCSMASAAAIAHGHANNLLRRAADVTIKERRPLVIVPRETPLSVIHLRNLADLAVAGATVIPPEPAFYLRHETVREVVDYIAYRTVQALGVIDDLPVTMQYRGSDDHGVLSGG